MTDTRGTIGDVAAMLGLSPRTVYEWARDGKIPGRKYWRTYRFDMDEVRRWAEEQRIGPKPEAPK